MLGHSLKKQRTEYEGFNLNADCPFLNFPITVLFQILVYVYDVYDSTTVNLKKTCKALNRLYEVLVQDINVPKLKIFQGLGYSHFGKKALHTDCTGFNSTITADTVLFNIYEDMALHLTPRNTEIWIKSPSLVVNFPQVIRLPAGRDLPKCAAAFAGLFMPGDTKLVKEIAVLNSMFYPSECWTVPVETIQAILAPFGQVQSLTIELFNKDTNALVPTFAKLKHLKKLTIRKLMEDELTTAAYFMKDLLVILPELSHLKLSIQRGPVHGVRERVDKRSVSLGGLRTLELTDADEMLFHWYEMFAFEKTPGFEVIIHFTSTNPPKLDKREKIAKNFYGAQITIRYEDHSWIYGPPEQNI